jgi:hypothetical protein
MGNEGIPADFPPVPTDTYTWLEIHKARHYLGMTVQEFLTHLGRGRIPVHRFGPAGDVVRFNADEVCAFGASVEAERKAAWDAEVASVRVRPLTMTVGWVYFVAAPEVGRVKIGHTDGRLSERLRPILTGSAVDVEPIGVMRGTKPVEWAIQGHFAPLRWKREWFRMDDRLRRFIGEFAGDPADANAGANLVMRDKEAKAFLAGISKRIDRWCESNP